MLHKLPVGAVRRAGAAVAMMSVVAVASTMTAPAAQATVGCSTAPSFDFSVPVPAAGPPSVYETGDGAGAPFAAVAVLGGDTQAYGFFSQFAADFLVTPMTCFQGSGIDQPAMVDNAQRTQYFLTSPNHGIYMQNITPDLTGGGWVRLPNALAKGGLDAVASGDRTDIFYVNNDANKNIMHMWQVGTRWFGPENLGGSSDDPPSVTRGADGKMHVWLTGTNGGIYFNSGDEAKGWRGWTKLASGSSTHGPAATVGWESTRAREDVFVTGTNGDLYQATFTNLGGFKGWNRIVPGVGADARISAAAQGPGHLVIAMSSFGETVETEFHTGSSSWSDLFLLPYLCDDGCLPVGVTAKAEGATPQSGPATRHVERIEAR